MAQRKTGIGADNCGYHLKEHIKGHLAEKKVECEDIGIFSPGSTKAYYEIASEMAERVADGKFDRGILICGTGMGMAIVANKRKGIYASVVESIYAARNSRCINNSNILTLGEFIIAPKLAEEIVDVWLETEFSQGWPEEETSWLEDSMDKIREIEAKRFK
jgi:ribose 5-phosphate isomerase B